MQIAGLETNINFLLDLAKHPEFVKGNVHTNFIKDYNTDLFPSRKPSEETLIQAALTVALTDELNDMNIALENNDQFNPFVVESCFRVNHKLERKIKFNIKNDSYEIKIRYLNPQEYQISTNDCDWKFVTGSISADEIGNLRLNYTIQDLVKKCIVYINENNLCVFGENGKTEFELEKPKYLSVEDGSEVMNVNRAVAPMPGVLDKLLVQKGDTVKQNDPLFVMIAMKMEHVVKASRDGKIAEVLFGVGNNVPKDAVVVKFEEETA